MVLNLLRVIRLFTFRFIGLAVVGVLVHAVKSDLELSRHFFPFDETGITRRFLWIAGNPWDFETVLREELQQIAMKAKQSTYDNPLFAEKRGEKKYVDEFLTAWDNQPASFKVKYFEWVARTYLERGQNDKAAQMFSELLLRQPSSSNLNLLQGLSLIEKDSRRAQHHLHLAALYLDQPLDEYSRFKLFQVWASVSLSNPDKQLQLVFFQLASFIDRGIGNQILRMADDLLGSADTNAVDQARMSRALIYKQQGRWAEAIDDLEKVSEHSALASLAWIQFTQIYKEVRNFPLRLKYLEFLLIREPLNRWVWTELESLLVKDLGSYERAVTVFSRHYHQTLAAELLPLLGRIEYLRGQLQNQLSYLRKYHQESQGSVESSLLLAESLILNGSYEEARQLVDHVHQKDPFEAKNWAFKGHLAYADKNYDVAIASYEHAQLLKNILTGDQLLELCQSLRQTLRFEKATRCFESVPENNKKFEIAQRLWFENESQRAASGVGK